MYNVIKHYKELLSLIVVIMVVSLAGCTNDENLEKAYPEQDTLNQLHELEDKAAGLESKNQALGNRMKELEETVLSLTDENIRLNKRLKLMELENETGLIRLLEVDDAIITDLRYATENNFTGQQVYPVSICLLQRGTAEKLKKANEIFEKDGYTIKVWDAYRPLDVQKIFWELVPDSRYVANPQKGSKHNRGTAVDITLVDDTGNEIEMPTGFDDFSEKASRNYSGCSEKAKENSIYMTRIMQESGFIPIHSEWWHFDDSQWKQYPILNISMDQFN